MSKRVEEQPPTFSYINKGGQKKRLLLKILLVLFFFFYILICPLNLFRAFFLLLPFGILSSSEMDAHLTTIGSTLDAIARLQASTPSSSKNVYRPFTCAVLNTYKLDVLDYIRDADQIESNLFWYPPLPGGISGNKGDVEVAAEGAAIAPGIAIRLPEPKEFIPPTPMRKNALEAEAKGLIQFDARTLLKAAQRLLEN